MRRSTLDTLLHAGIITGLTLMFSGRGEPLFPDASDALIAGLLSLNGILQLAVVGIIVWDYFSKLSWLKE